LEEVESKLKNERYKNESQHTQLKQRVEELEDSIERREKYHEDRSAGYILDKASLETQVKN
jgi:predicted nuclease with TOPRIM domain